MLLVPGNNGLLAAGETDDDTLVVHELLEAAHAVGVIAGQHLHNREQVPIPSL